MLPQSPDYHYSCKQINQRSAYALLDQKLNRQAGGNGSKRLRTVLSGNGINGIRIITVSIPHEGTFRKRLPGSRSAAYPALGALLLRSSTVHLQGGVHLLWQEDCNQKHGGHSRQPQPQFFCFREKQQCKSR